MTCSRSASRSERQGIIDNAAVQVELAGCVRVRRLGLRTGRPLWKGIWQYRVHGGQFSLRSARGLVSPPLETWEDSASTTS